MTDTREQKNNVFVPQNQPQEHVPAQPKSLVDTTVELVPLPSNGLVYSHDHPLHNCSMIEIKAMTSREEDILTSRSLLKKGTVLTELLRSCIIDKRVDPLHLLSGDRNALLIAIRVTGYGNDYTAKVKCGNDDCEVESDRHFDLAQLPIKRLSIPPAASGSNLFEYKLPLSKRNVKFKFLTGADEQEMATVAERYRKMGVQMESNVTSALQHVVQSVDGITDRAQIMTFVQNMRALDSSELRKYIRQNEPGIDMKQSTTCPACGHIEEVTVPLGVSFLWPGSE